MSVPLNVPATFRGPMCEESSPELTSQMWRTVAANRFVFIIQVVLNVTMCQV